MKDGATDAARERDLKHQEKYLRSLMLSTAYCINEFRARHCYRRQKKSLAARA